MLFSLCSTYMPNLYITQQLPRYKIPHGSTRAPTCLHRLRVDHGKFANERHASQHTSGREVPIVQDKARVRQCDSHSRERSRSHV
jgi:hypothetical protein